MPDFTLRIRVRYNECDQQNVVFNARYADYVDLASTEFLRSVLGGYQELVKQGYENQIVRLLIEWKAPARFDDIIDLKVSVGRVGNSSFSLETEVRNADTEQLLATAEAVYVFVDAKSFATTAIPDFVRASFEDHANYGVVDQTGMVDQTGV